MMKNSKQARDDVLRILLAVLMGMTLAWKPQPRQVAALRRAEKEVLYGGARFGGKSEAGRAWLVEPSYLSNPRYQGLVIRKNATDLAEWIEKTRVFYHPIGANITGNPPVIRFPAGGIVWLGHLKDESAYEKYQGWELHKILVEELTQIPRESDYEKLISSCRSTVPGLPPQVFCTANPGGPGHVWVKSRFQVNLPAYKAGHLKEICSGRGLQPLPAPTPHAFIPVHRTGHSAEFRQ